MGNLKLKWTPEEEDALLAGVAKHGTGKWKNILRDPEFAQKLANRSNIDLKDKWRNISVGPGSASKDKTRTPKVKAAAAAVAAAVAVANGSVTPNIRTQKSAPAALPTHNESSDMLLDDHALNTASDGKNVPRYDALIYEALSALGDSDGDGFDPGAIVSFIEQRHEVPPNFRRVIGSRLRRLAAQNKLKKIQNSYKMCEASKTIAKPPIPKTKDVRIKNPNNQTSTVSKEIFEEAASTAAYKVVEAEIKTCSAADAIREYEKMKNMAEEAVMFLQIAEEIYERCCNGEVVHLA